MVILLLWGHNTKFKTHDQLVYSEPISFCTRDGTRTRQTHLEKDPHISPKLV